MHLHTKAYTFLTFRITYHYDRPAAAQWPTSWPCIIDHKHYYSEADDYIVDEDAEFAISLAQYFSSHTHINWAGGNNTARVSLISLCTQVWGHLGILEEKVQNEIISEAKAEKAFTLLVKSGFKAAEEPPKKAGLWKVCADSFRLCVHSSISCTLTRSFATITTPARHS